MPNYCCAFGCNNKSDKSESKRRNVSYHHLPLENKFMLKRWLAAMKREYFVPSKHTRLCSDHFDEECFTYQKYKNISKRYLRDDAIPTKFDFFGKARWKKKCDERKKISSKKKRLSRNNDKYHEDEGTSSDPVLSGDFLEISLMEEAAKTVSNKGIQTDESFTALVEELKWKNEEVEESNRKITTYLNPDDMSDEEMKTFSGFNKEIFFQIFHFFNLNNTLKEDKLPPIQQFFIFMAKLKTGMTVDILAYLFRVSITFNI